MNKNNFYYKKEHTEVLNPSLIIVLHISFSNTRSSMNYLKFRITHILCVLSKPVRIFHVTNDIEKLIYLQ